MDVLGAHRAARDELELTARLRAPGGAVVVAAEAGASTIPPMADRDVVDGRPAAYVCRNLVCERPVTDPADLGRVLGSAAGGAS